MIFPPRQPVHSISITMWVMEITPWLYRLRISQTRPLVFHLAAFLYSLWLLLAVFRVLNPVPLFHPHLSMEIHYILKTDRYSLLQELNHVLHMKCKLIWLLIFVPSFQWMGILTLAYSVNVLYFLKSVQPPWYQIQCGRGPYQ